jgi:hypothetical protein
MTPQLALVPRIATHAAHLTEDQFGELLAASSRTAASGNSDAQAHLLSCERCAAELASLRESLSLFRQASAAYANDELRQLPQMPIPARRPMLSPMPAQAYWAFAAAATFLVALLPMEAFRQHTLQPQQAIVTTMTSVSAESDDALLEDINQKVSASVPSPMQALADPAADVTSTGIASSVPTSDQRKD